MRELPAKQQAPALVPATRLAEAHMSVTVKQLIEELQQYPDDLAVYLTESEVEEPGEFVTLDSVLQSVRNDT